MRIIAYVYSDRLLESPPDHSIWGVEVERVYSDWGSDEQLQLLLKNCQLSPPDYLLLRRLEELGQDLLTISDRLENLENLGIEIIAIEQNYSSHQGRETNLVKNRQQWFELIPEIQKYQQNQRQKQGHARNRIQALPPPGKAPYGYQRSSTGYILDLQASAIIKDFFDDYLLNGSLRQAVRHLEKRHGKIVSTSTAQRWLTHPVYRGNLQYQNNQIIPHTHPPILSREEAAQIDRLLRQNRPFNPRTATAPRSLAGLVFCQTCSSALTISQVKSGKGEKIYLYLRGLNCPQRPKCKAIAYEEILNQVINQICQELPLAVRNSKAPNLSGIKQIIQQQIEQKEKIIEQLPVLVKQEILDQEMANLRQYQLKIELAQLQQKLDQLPPGELSQIIKNVALPQFWLDLSEIERRFYFREFIRQIQVIYSGRSPQEWEIKLIFVF